MAEPRRVVLFAGGRVDSLLDLSPLEAAGCTVERCYNLENCQDEEKIVAALSGSVAVVAGSERYSRSILERLPKLRLIARVGVGYDRVDVGSATALGKLVSTTANTVEPAVAEWTVAHILAVRRRLLQADRAVRSGRWIMPEVLGPSLVGATVGIVGLGRIAREVVNRLTARDRHRRRRL
jgi:D-3-phosphoglycerate dehydrogenase